MGVRERRRHKRRVATVKQGICIIVFGILFGGLMWQVFDRQKAVENSVFETENETQTTEMQTETVRDASEGEYAFNTEQTSIEEQDEIAAITTIEKEYQRILNLSAGDLAISGMVSEELTDRLFYSTKINEDIFSKINGISYTKNDYVDIEDLCYLKMLYYGIDGNTYVGEMIVNQKIADTVLEIFQTLYENQYPIERMVLVDNYQANDESSMSDNNTSSFNYRPIAGSSKLSKHSYGLAIDINPKYNPCVKTAADGSTLCQPANGADYIDRSKDFTYKIDTNDLAYQLFTAAGFIWGGNWNSLKDYQHFEMSE